MFLSILEEFIASVIVRFCIFGLCFNSILTQLTKIGAYIEMISVLTTSENVTKPPTYNW